MQNKIAKCLRNLVLKLHTILRMYNWCQHINNFCKYVLLLENLSLSACIAFGKCRNTRSFRFSGEKPRAFAMDGRELAFSRQSVQNSSVVDDVLSFSVFFPENGGKWVRKVGFRCIYTTSSSLQTIRRLAFWPIAWLRCSSCTGMGQWDAWIYTTLQKYTFQLFFVKSGWKVSGPPARLCVS